MTFLETYVERVLRREVESIGPETPLFWSTWGRLAVGKTRAPMTGKNIWRLSRYGAGSAPFRRPVVRHRARRASHRQNRQNGHGLVAHPARWNLIF